MIAEICFNILVGFTSISFGLWQKSFASAFFMISFLWTFRILTNIIEDKFDMLIKEEKEGE